MHACVRLCCWMIIQVQIAHDNFYAVPVAPGRARFLRPAAVNAPEHSLTTLLRWPCMLLDRWWGF